MKNYYSLLTFFCCSFSFVCLWGQSKAFANDKKGIFIDLNLGAGIPFGELKERFGFHQIIGGGLSYEPPPGRKLSFGLKYSFAFGNTVNEDVLAPYRTSDLGQVIGEDGLLNNVQLKERATWTHLYTGSIWPLGHQDVAIHGLSWRMGVGFLQHRIRIQDDARSATQLNSDFRKGLDRLTNGFSVLGFIGYEFRSHSGRVNFYSGFEPILGFTEIRRSYNYDLQNSTLNKGRNDFMLNFKFGWYLPFFIKDDSALIEY
ncbi:MAG: hypothetical protein KA251_03140 [Saprospiraceae bacterium]|nr:hypothetical protein [Candidatus Vicinibacter affinis]MBK7696033.1 hypothetical protein [Candidatus Vicinibacter affinis]MBK8642166.1 hypothetical protein [Candidatus Vicinibacter affinis]MBP6172531.1 hypothetical protein [Saprospiraceae bacterium]MBP6521954.1 hypothetical protein [Saprospiraceae bacterium]